MTPEELAQQIAVHVGALLAERGTEQSAGFDPADVVVERPKNREHGDWATSIAMRLAGRIGENPRALAADLAERIGAVEGISAAEVAGPGFINITLDAASAGSLVKTIVEQGEGYGTGTSLAGRKLNLEFVSANPTGPLHIGHTRWAALGDSIVRILRASGAEVVSEYYINDAGSQMDNFGLSVLAAAKGEPTPENGYPGAYIADLARHVLAEVPDLLERPAEEALELAREHAYRRQLSDIQASLQNFNVHFDVWFSERTLHAADPESGRSRIDVAQQRLRELGHVYDADDAVWVRTTTFGDDKDRVMTRGNGVPTYFAADAAYYLDKKDRGYDEKIYLLGADHHGYVGRLKALAAAAGDDPETGLTVLIGQLVNLGGAKLSKRAGNIIELDDLLEWLGADALRYWLARYPADSPLNLDGEQLRKRSNDNPVFYVQYAHARTRSVARNAAEAGVDRSSFDPSLLTHETESVLLAALGEYPRVVEQAALVREPHRIARYLEQLAGYYHRWYDSCRVLPFGDEQVSDVHRTRLWLNEAVHTVLRNGLGLLGVSAPERM